MTTAAPGRRPRLGRTPDWAFPEPETYALDNGLRVWLFPLPGQYVLSAELVLDLPVDVEPADREGVAAITLSTLDEGTLEHPGPSFTEALEDSGAVFGGEVMLAATTCSLQVPVTGFADAVPLFAEACLRPAFAEADVARHVARRLADIDQIAAHSSQLASVLTRRAVFAPSRTARLTHGGSTTVAAVTRDDTEAFHAAHYSPDGATLILAGDFTGLDPLTAVKRAFGSWAATGSRPAHSTPPRALPTATLAKREGAVQADLRLASYGIDRRDPRWPAMQIACHAMGGAFLSRLNKVLREERGYTYGVSMASHPLRSGGYLTVGGSFRTDVLPAALAEARTILDVTDRPFTDREVADALAHLVGTMPLRYATAEAVAGQAAILAAAGLEASYVNENNERLRTVTPERATEVFTEFWPADPSVVVVGDESLAGPLDLPSQDIGDL